MSRYFRCPVHISSCSTFLVCFLCAFHSDFESEMVMWPKILGVQCLGCMWLSAVSAHPPTSLLLQETLGRAFAPVYLVAPVQIMHWLQQYDEHCQPILKHVRWVRPQQVALFPITSNSSEKWMVYFLHAVLTESLNSEQRYWKLISFFTKVDLTGCRSVQFFSHFVINCNCSQWLQMGH